MTWPIVTMPIETESDVVAVRQRARRLAELLGVERQDQTRLATAVSEIAQWRFTPGAITQQLMADYSAEVQPKGEKKAA